jgi:general secretion pathway protein N
MIRYGVLLGLAAGMVIAGDAGPQAIPALARVVEPPKSAQPAGPAAEAAPLAANPLWGVPLGSLSATRERPLFSPSRRPPPPPVPAAVSAPPAKPPPPKVAEPDRPLLSPVATIVAGGESIAVFLDQATREVVRLRIGEGHDGWILRSVEGRQASFEKDRRTATLALPPHAGEPGGQPPPAAQPALPTQPATPVAGKGGSGTWMDGDGRMISPPPPAAALPR